VRAPSTPPSALFTWIDPDFPRLRSEALYEDDTFPERELAALVAAKVYYNLQEYNESMFFALGAGKLFNLDHDGEFEETIICMPIFYYRCFVSVEPCLQSLAL